MLSAMDDGVGEVLKALRRHGLEENTLVIFHSDNGAPNRAFFRDNGPLRGYKGQVYQGGIRIPFMMQWKGRIKEGLLYEEPVLSLDLLPTAVSLGGGKVEAEWGIDGVDLMPFLSGENAGAPHEALFWRFREHWAIRKGEWTLVRQQVNGPAELYNLTEDVGESRDLAREDSTRAKQLEEIYSTWNREMVAPRWEIRDEGKRQNT